MEEVGLTGTLVETDLGSSERTSLVSILYGLFTIWALVAPLSYV